MYLADSSMIDALLSEKGSSMRNSTPMAMPVQIVSFIWKSLSFSSTLILLKTSVNPQLTVAISVIKSQIKILFLNHELCKKTF